MIFAPAFALLQSLVVGQLRSASLRLNIHLRLVEICNLVTVKQFY